MSQATSLFFDQESTDGSQSRIRITSYSAEEVIRQFSAIYNCLDFKAELEDLGVGRFQFSRRKKAIREFRMLCIALWGLALQKSFPTDAREFFDVFRTTLPELKEGREAAVLQNRINIYIDLLNPKKDTDFSPVAAYIAEMLAPDEADQRRLRLKLSLLIRNLYMLIFDKLV